MYDPIDLRDGVRELFEEASRKGREQRTHLGELRIVRAPATALQPELEIPEEGTFLVPPPPYSGTYLLTIGQAPCRVERWTCDVCGHTVEWREGNTRARAYHLTKGGRCPGASSRTS